MPLRDSLVTRFSLSTSFCISLNFGRATEKISITTPIRIITATAIIQLRDMLLFKAIMIPPIPMMGEKASILSPMVVNICIWVTSLVVRVMRVEAEKLSNSSREKDSTFLKTSCLNFLARPAPILDDV